MIRKRYLRILLASGSILYALAARADVSIGPDVIVTGTEIKVLRPGPDLQAIIDGIDDAFDPATGIFKRYLIKLGPGDYTITADGTTGFGLVMKPFISIAGSGQGVTVLSGSISSSEADSTSSIVTGASNTSISDLSVFNSGGAEASIAIWNGGASHRMENIAVSASGGSSSNFGVVVSGAVTPIIRNVTAEAFQPNGVGLVMLSGASPRIDSSTIQGPLAIIGVNSGARISNTQLIGPVQADSPGNQCRDTYDENLDDVPC